MNQELFNSLSDKYQDIYSRLCMQVDTNISLDSVILSDENKEKIDKFIKETEYKEKFMRYGFKPINRIINYGASGTGKTYMTKALANYFGYELIYIDIAKALSSGTAAQSLEEIFDLGNHIGKAIIFLDECDAISRARDSKTSNEDPAVRRANNALFQLLDQMNPNCIFVSATNLYNELDAAFIRRFNLKLKFDRPDLGNLDESINKFLKKDFILNQDMQQDVKDILMWHGRNYTQLSYFEIQDWVERAEKNALIHDTLEVSENEIYGYFMQSMRVKVGYDRDNKLYLYQD